MPKPIKRAESLKPLSREHHYGLLLCWKIRTGLKRSVAPSRIAAYVEYFYDGYLAEHFNVEEDALFPLLGNGHPMVQKALEQHEAIRAMVIAGDKGEAELSRLADALDAHIRFEERELFNEIQREVGEAGLARVEELHRDVPGAEDWPDEFWL